jgi:5-methyltetrahydrofolate--homocysteine methyltransferase
VDVCLANPDRDEKADMRSFLPFLVRKVKAPWMIDSTDPAVVEEALKLCPGKAVINSVNLEEGEKRLQRTVPLARGFGAALVVGAIDEDKASGMAVTRERKLAIVRRSHALLTEKYGMPEEDLYFDPLVFPCASGDKAYAGSALETIEGLRLIKKEFPRCPTLLGISNVSFGLPPAGREALNSVFLRHCVEAGLDFAIVNSEKLARFAALPAAERELCERVLFKGTPEAVAEFAAAYRQAKPPATDSRVGLPAAERARLCVVEGSKEGLREALDELSASRPPLEIVNGPLMEGMDEVGRLFGENRLIVAEVLQSAEVMQEAVSILEPRMGKGSAAPRGRVLLATVKGDVHDIGKNLVHIILKNNGYAVSDAGIKVSPEALIAKAREFRPDIIGLSGLLVKSTQQMAATAADMREAGIRAPLLVGGAALTERFAASRIAPAYGGPVLYAKDAMTGLSLANRLSDPARREALLSENRSRQAGLAGPAVGGIPAPPDFKVHAMADIDPKEVFGRLDMARLCGRHLGVGEAGGSKGAEIRGRIESLMAEAAAAGWVKPKAVYRFVQARSSRGGLLLFDGDRALEAFSFPRLANGACLADLVSGDGKDNMALFALTCGEGVAELSDRFRESGEYLKSHALRALAVEAAEALAEMVHARLRFLWGIPASQGARASIGYPACPAIEDQAKVFRLLDPEKSIGLRLGESFVMDPEASVTALVFH